MGLSTGNILMKGKAASGIRTTTDGGLILSGEPNVLMKLSNQGVIEWQKRYAGFRFGRASLGYWAFNNTVHEVSGSGYVIGATQPEEWSVTDNPISLIKTDTGGSCSSLDSDTAIVPVATNLVKIQSTTIPMPSSLSASPPDISEIEINTAIEQIAP